MSMNKPILRTTLTEQVATRLIQMISAGHWKPGERLPSEPELCQTFNVGRSTLREALTFVAFIGILDIRHGEGTFVMDGSSRLLERVFNQGLFNTETDDLSHTRMALEGEAVTLCARRASEEDLRNLKKLVNEMQLSVHDGGERFIDLDLEYHLSIAAYSQNQILANLLKTIRGILHDIIKKSQEIPDAQQLACIHHEHILEALEAHDPRRARSAMRKHLSIFQRRYEMLLEAARSDANSGKGLPASPTLTLGAQHVGQ